MRGVGGIVSASRRGGGHWLAGGGGATPPPSYPGVLHGAWINGPEYDPSWGDAPWDSRTIAQFAADAGKGCAIIHFGQSWGSGGSDRTFLPGLNNLCRNAGAYPMIDWSPADFGLYGSSTTQPAYSFANILAGTKDAYMDSWGAAAAAWGHPFFVRLMHEMNGDWFPWSEGVNGNATGSFVPTWQYIVNRVRAAGATNITWVWCPNTIYDGVPTPLTGLYPGDAYVDWVGTDPYNWGTSGGHNEPNVWLSDRLGPTYDQVYTLAGASKPFMFGEWGCSETVGSKAAWFLDAFNVVVTEFPHVRALVYYNRDVAGADWRIETSLAAQNAYASGVAPSWFKGAVYGSASTSPIPAPA